jgi:hypothetical protein
MSPLAEALGNAASNQTIAHSGRKCASTSKAISSQEHLDAETLSSGRVAKVSAPPPKSNDIIGPNFDDQ